jgi:tetratricopeptide (TPR) repeat protein
VARAERLLRESSELLRRLLGDGHPMVASGYNNLASLLDEQGSLDEAEALYRQALAIRRRALPADHPHTAYVLDGLGQLLLRTGSLQEARALLEEALALRARRLGDRHPDTARVRGALGEALVRLGESVAGERELRAARDALEAAGPDHGVALRTLEERLALLTSAARASVSGSGGEPRSPPR